MIKLKPDSVFYRPLLFQIGNTYAKISIFWLQLEKGTNKTVETHFITKKKRRIILNKFHKQNGCGFLIIIFKY